MSEGGAALMAVGQATGEDRARVAAEQAISSQLLDVTINGAHGILFNVTGGNSLSLFEVNEAAAIIKETAHQDVNLIFGAVIDESMGEDLRITVIATGFDQNNPPNYQDIEHSQIFGTSRRPGQILSTSDFQHKGQGEDTGSADNHEFPTLINTDDLDVPAFLRKRQSS